MFLFKKSAAKVASTDALPGRPEELATAINHYLLPVPLKGPYPGRHQKAMFGLGCFWGAERKFWGLGRGIIATAVGYSGGDTPNPTYDEVCTGLTNHNEVVLVVFDPTKISYETLLKTFWESHNPTQDMRQGNDVGSSYRSAIFYLDDEQKAIALDTIADVDASGLWPGKVVTEVTPAAEFWEAEPEHQDYLERYPNGGMVEWMRNLVGG